MFNMKKSVMVLALLAMVGVAQADEYSCKVYCKNGTTYVDVNANSKSEAAAKVDNMPDQVCKGEGKGDKSSQTMRPEQCSRK
jgi:hypothetical protein